MNFKNFFLSEVFKVSPEIEQQVTQASKQPGVSINSLSNQFKLDNKTIRRIVLQNNPDFKISHKTISPNRSVSDFKDQILDYVNKNYDYTEIGKALGFSSNAISRFLNELGIKHISSRYNKIRDLTIKGYSGAKIAKMLNVDEGTVYRIRKQLIAKGLLNPSDYARESKLTLLKKKEIKRLRQQGLSVTEIGKRVGIGHSTITDYLRSLPDYAKLTVNSKMLNKRNQILDLAKQGKSNGEISDIIDLPYSTVATVIARFGKDIRKQQRQKIIDEIIRMRQEGVKIIKIANALHVSPKTVVIVLKNHKLYKSGEIPTKPPHEPRNKLSPKTLKPAKDTGRVYSVDSVSLPPNIINNSEITEKFIKYLQEKESDLIKLYAKQKIGSINDPKFQPVDPSKFTSRELNNIINVNYIDEITMLMNRVKKMPFAKFLQQLKDYNISFNLNEYNWLKMFRHGGITKYSRAGRKAIETMNRRFKKFKNSAEGKKIRKQGLKDNLSKEEIIANLKKRYKELRTQAEEKGEVFDPGVEFSSIQGKLKNRKFEFDAISSYVNAMPDTIKVLSLPEEYSFEKGISSTFNKNVEVYGAEARGLKLAKQFGLKAQKDSGNKIHANVTDANINELINAPDKHFFYKTEGDKKRLYVPNNFNIIDLDYLGIPGTLIGNTPMRLNVLHNPFLYPVKAAKELLAPGGLLFVTYTLFAAKNANITKTNVYNKQKNLFDLKLDDKGYFKQNKPNDATQQSMESETVGFNLNRYNESAPIANLYINGIVNYAKTSSVNLDIVYANIYKGSFNNVMFRAVFLKS
jgi:DNA-binding NarL/FixJ family response regulator